MWSRSSSKGAAARARIPTRTCGPVLAAVAVLAGCHSAPPKPAQPAPVPVPSAPSATPAKAAAGAAPAGVSAAATPGATAAAPAAARPEVSAAASADFARAVGYMRAGNATEAELGFKQMALQYPQFAAPLTNLGILYRKSGRLADSEQALKSAVEHETDNAIAWCELGVTQRMRGEFKDAAASYEAAIKADPDYAPAWRNLGVVSDLYLGDPQRALAAFSRYQELTKEEKPVSGWIAELRQRLGMPPLKRPAAAPPAPAAPPAEAPAAAPPIPSGTQSAPAAPNRSGQGG